MVTREDFWEIRALFSKLLEKCDEVHGEFRANLDFLESSMKETGFEDPGINNENQEYDLQLGFEEATNAEPDDSARNRECSERLVLTKPSAGKIIDCEDAEMENGVANEKLQMECAQSIDVESSYWANSKECSDKVVVSKNHSVSNSLHSLLLRHCSDRKFDNGKKGVPRQKIKNHGHCACQRKPHICGMAIYKLRTWDERTIKIRVLGDADMLIKFVWSYEATLPSIWDPGGFILDLKLCTSSFNNSPSFFSNVLILRVATWFERCVNYRYDELRPWNCACKVFDKTSVPCWVSQMVIAFVIDGGAKIVGVVFDRMPQQDPMTWNSMIEGYAHYKKLKNALYWCHKRVVEATSDIILVLFVHSHTCSYHDRSIHESKIRCHIDITVGYFSFDFFFKQLIGFQVLRNRYRVVMQLIVLRNNVFDDSKFEIEKMSSRNNVYEHAFDELVELGQWSTVGKNRKQFLVLANRIEGVSEILLISCFVCRFEEEIRAGVQLFQPHTDKAMGLAMLQEMNIKATTKGDFGGSSTPFVHQIEQPTKTSCNGDAEEKPKGFGCVNFILHDEAKMAMENLNGALLETHTLLVRRAYKNTNIREAKKVIQEQDQKLVVKNKNVAAALKAQAAMLTSVESPVVKFQYQEPETVVEDQEVEMQCSECNRTMEVMFHLSLGKKIASESMLMLKNFTNRSSGFLSIAKGPGRSPTMKDRTMKVHKKIGQQKFFIRQNRDGAMDVCVYKISDPGGIIPQYDIGFMPLVGYCYYESNGILAARDDRGVEILLEQIPAVPRQLNKSMIIAYKQSSVQFKATFKLSPRFYGSYPVLQKIGAVAYKLALPPSSRIHPVFHVSLLKKKLGSQVVPQSLLPAVSEAGTIEPVPAAVLDRRLVKLKGGPATQLLIQWSNSFPEDGTWEFYTSLKSKFPTLEPCGQGFSEGRGNDTHPNSDPAGVSLLATRPVQIGREV